MSIWSAEIKDLEQVYLSLKGTHPELEKELGKLIHSEDENMILVYARRCLEVIITELCEEELNRKRGTEPLQRIIDKLNKEEKVPQNIIVSMLGVNSMSAFGAHPKEYDTRQLKPVLSNLTAVLCWYLSYRGIEEAEMVEEGKYNDAEISQKNSNANKIDSIAILPFDNFTGNDSLEYFVSGMHSSLISDMGRISGLRVIGKTSSNVYRNTTKSIPVIASELNVGAIMESEVLGLGDNICIQIKLIRTIPEEKPLWHGTFNEDKSRILLLYNNVTKKIAEEVKVKLTPREENQLSGSRLVDREVYDAYLKSFQYTNDFSFESLDKAREYLNAAIEKDSTWAPLYAGLTNVWMYLQQMGHEPPSVAAPEIIKNLNKALELDPDNSVVLGAKALFTLVGEWDWEKSEEEYLHALDVNPNDADARVLYAQLLCIVQRKDEALSHGRLAFETDPLNSNVKCFYATILISVGDFKSALKVVEEVTRNEPWHILANAVIQIAAYQCKDIDKLINANSNLLTHYWNFNEDDIQEYKKAIVEKGFITASNQIINRLEHVAKNNDELVLDMSTWCMFANQPEKAIDWLERAYEVHNPAMPYITTGMFDYEPLYDNPRFLNIVEKMNLSIPKN